MIALAPCPAPVLTTERLRLRPMVPGDWPAYAALMASDRACHMGGPFDTPAAWGLFCHDAAGWALWGLGALMIERRADGVTVGQVGISKGPLFPETELGWMLYAGFEGQGFATEAGAALRDFAMDRVPTLVSYVGPQNAASAAVALRLGAVSDPAAPRQPGDDEDLVFRHARGARA
jgi:RimJ/RimL family protein N-acetyltransferase